jgi:hypothetical protein
MPKDTKTIRRSVDIALDLNAYLSWYSSMGERSVIGIVDEAIRAWYDTHKGDFPNGPTVTSKPVDPPRHHKRGQSSEV